MTPDELEQLKAKAKAEDNPYVLGAIPSGVRGTDWVASAENLPHAAPPTFTHPAVRKVPVKNQQGGTCVGNAIGNCMTYLEWVEKNDVVVFDGEELNMRVVGHDYGEGAAASPHDVLEDVRLHGARAQSGLYFPKAYAWVEPGNVEAVKAAMTAPGTAVTAAIWLQDNFGLDGGKTYAPFHEENPWGYHEITYAGYTDQGVLIQNSWGTWWGDGGFALLSWDYLAHRTGECWAITDNADTAKDGFVKTFNYGDDATETPIKRFDLPDRLRPAVYLAWNNGRRWITDPWQAKRFGVDLTKVQKKADTDPFWALPVIGPDAPRSQR